MYIKFIIFAIFVTFGESASAVSSTPFYGLSEENLALLSKLGANQEKAILARYDGHDKFFNLLKKLAVEYIYDFRPKTSRAEIAAIIAEVTRNNKIGVDYFLDSIPIALRKSCDDIGTTRRRLHSYLDYSSSLLAPVIELARSGNYSAIQVSREVVSFGPTFVRPMYNLIRNCENTTDADTLAAIRIAESRSAAGIYYKNNGIYNGMKLLGIAIAFGNKSLGLISDLQEAREKTFIGLRIELINEYSVLEGLYINSVLNRRGIGSELIRIQYATISRIYNSRMLVRSIFTEITNKWNRIIFGIFDDGEEVFSRTDLAEAKTVALIDDGSNRLFESIRGNSSVMIQERKNLHALSVEIVSNHFLMIKVAVNKSKTYSEIIAEINILKSKTVCLAGQSVKILISLIRNGQTWSHETEAKFAIFENNAVREAKNYIESIRDGAEILANATYGNGTVSTNSIIAIQAAQSRGIAASDKYVKYLAEASIFSLMARIEK